jgi:peptidoglycan/xylan/chitin deacetylase (PgdA/CDA1 family)
MIRGGSDEKPGNAHAAPKNMVALKPQPPAIPEYITAQACTAKGPTLRYSATTRAKKVALTFDDGPGPGTSKVLDVLAQFNASAQLKHKATFFVVGRQVRGYRSLMQRIVREGHAPGNHSWSHRVPGVGIANELSYTQKAVKETTGVTPCVARAPGGQYWSFTAAARQQKLNLIQWDVDTNDWKSPAASVIANGVLANMKPGSIILMHDGPGYRTNTIAALPAILRGLKKRGYQSVTVPELLGLTKKKPQPRVTFREVRM